MHSSTLDPDADLYLRRYDRMAFRAARQVISSYSTSFGLATRMLGKQQRTDIRNLYAMVRIADEIVDGTTKAAGFDIPATTALLEEYERQVLGRPATALPPRPHPACICHHRPTMQVRPRTYSSVLHINAH